MERLTPPQRLEIVKIYYKSGSSVRATFRALREAHFWLNGFVNKQNMRYWAETNPQVIHERGLHPQKVTVWCGLWSGGIIGPYFFENQRGEAVTVNGERYRQMITNFVWPELDEMDLGEMWFQQDGATCHTSDETMNVLKEKFGESIISKSSQRQTTVNWPPRSCDLTPLDFFLWGYVKSLVYAWKPTWKPTSSDRFVIFSRPYLEKSSKIGPIECVRANDQEVVI